VEEFIIDIVVFACLIPFRVKILEAFVKQNLDFFEIILFEYLCLFFKNILIFHYVFCKIMLKSFQIQFKRVKIFTKTKFVMDE